VKRWLLFLWVFALAGCSTAAGQSDGQALPEAPVELPVEGQAPVELPDLGPAPELSNEVWLNVDEPLRLADLRGKVVAIDMWTFG
jgi:hypothetical protein